MPVVKCPKCGASYKAKDEQIGKSFKCKCGETVKQDLAGDHYLSHPVIGKPEDVGFWCEHCDNEWTEKMVLEITLTAVTGENSECPSS